MMRMRGTQLRRWCAAAAGLVACLPGVVGRAEAGIELRFPTSHVDFDLASMPAAFNSGDFSLIAWVWIDAPESPSSRMIFGTPDRFEVRAGVDGRITASLIRPVQPDMVEPPSRQDRLRIRTPILEGDEPPKEPRTGSTAGPMTPTAAKLQKLTATASGPASTDAWTLVCVRFERSKGKLSVWTRSAGGVARAGAALDASWKGFGFDDRQRLLLGGNAGSSFTGQIGLAVIRPEQVTGADLDAVFSSRRLLAPFDLDTRAQGGAMSGSGGVEWMIGHSMPTFPSSGSGGSTFERASVVGRLVGPYNVTVYQSRFGQPPVWNRTWLIAGASDAFFASANDGRYAGFFRRDLWDTGVGPGWVAGTSAPGAELVSGAPAGLMRIIASSNSRGVKNGDGSGLSPGNYAHGFIEKYRALTSGILMRPAILTAGANPWFGFDCALMNPQQSAPGTIIELSATPDNAGDFGRFFTGSAAFGRGPGAGVLLLPGASYAMRCRPESLSQLIAAAPLEVEAYVMLYPGASRLKWRGDRGPNQGAPGVTLPWNTLEADTTRVSLTPDSVIYQTQTVLAFFGDQRGVILPGDACAVTSGPGARSISLVKSVAFDGIRTRATLEKPLRQAPTGASVVNFGPWEIRSLRVDFAPVLPGDPNTWRGIGFQAEAGGAGTPVFAFSAVRPDVPGFAFGTAGWGGHGYQQQLDGSFEEANRAWMALTRADLWFQVPAEQLSTPAVMSTYTDLLRSALPGVSIIWAGESGLLADTNTNWHQYIFDHAAEKGVVGLSLLEHPRVGNLHEQYADGLLSDGDHYSQRGNRRLADLWIAQLRMALRPGCPGDYDQSGVLDAADLAAFQIDLAGQDPDADYNADDLVDGADLTAFLEKYAQGC
jgi:hypothetical protein